METIYKIIATFFYSGYSPVAPGTAGTVAAAILYGVLWWSGVATWPVLLGVMLLASVLNVLTGAWAENHFETKDPKQVVIDEVAGFFLTVSLFKASWAAMIAGFFAFRFFDILKPFPCNKLEKFPKGWGVLLDDLMAGIYAALSLVIISFLLQKYPINYVHLELFWK